MGTERIFKHFSFARETNNAELRFFGNKRPALNPFPFSSLAVISRNRGRFPSCPVNLCGP
jgi:hypothetical protein